MIDVINGISSPELSAKSLVSFGEMGCKAGEYLAKLHPAGSEPVKVAWFPGPPGAGWVEAGNTGLPRRRSRAATIEVVDTKYGDTGKEVQLKLVEDMLEAHPDINYIVGTAVTAEAATGLLRDARARRTRSRSSPTTSRRACIRASGAARSWPRRPIPR